MTTGKFLILTMSAVQLVTLSAAGSENGTKGRSVSMSMSGSVSVAVGGCVFSGCTDIRNQQNVGVAVTGSIGIYRPPCFCQPLECPNCCPDQVRPTHVFEGHPEGQLEPPEMAWSCNRNLHCLPTPPCPPCQPTQVRYDICICYGPGACACWVWAENMIPPWRPKPPCYCSPQTCSGCCPGGVDPYEIIPTPLNMLDPRAVSVSHGCDWKIPCVPPPACQGCMVGAGIASYDACICYGNGICACFVAPQKPACYCQPQICPKCFLERGMPAQVIVGSYGQTGTALAISTGCNAYLPCIHKPSCRPCQPTDLRYDVCIYFSPGLNACFTGRGGILTGIFSSVFATSGKNHGGIFGKK